jgi:hypothetical protein
VKIAEKLVVNIIVIGAQARTIINVMIPSRVVMGC